MDMSSCCCAIHIAVIGKGLLRTAIWIAQAQLLPQVYTHIAFRVLYNLAAGTWAVITSCGYFNEFSGFTVSSISTTLEHLSTLNHFTVWMTLKTRQAICLSLKRSCWEILYCTPDLIVSELTNQIEIEIMFETVWPEYQKHHLPFHLTPIHHRKMKSCLTNLLCLKLWTSKPLPCDLLQLTPPTCAYTYPVTTIHIN